MEVGPCARIQTGARRIWTRRCYFRIILRPTAVRKQPLSRGDVRVEPEGRTRSVSSRTRFRSRPAFSHPRSRSRHASTSRARPSARGPRRAARQQLEHPISEPFRTPQHLVGRDRAFAYPAAPVRPHPWRRHRLDRRPSADGDECVQRTPPRPHEHLDQQEPLPVFPGQQLTGRPLVRAAPPSVLSPHRGGSSSQPILNSIAPRAAPTRESVKPVIELGCVRRTKAFVVVPKQPR